MGGWGNLFGRLFACLLACLFVWFVGWKEGGRQGGLSDGMDGGREPFLDLVLKGKRGEGGWIQYFGNGELIWYEVSFLNKKARQ